MLNVNVFGQREEPGQNLHRHTVNVSVLHRKDPQAREWNLQPCCCEATPAAELGHWAQVNESSKTLLKNILAAVRLTGLAGYVMHLCHHIEELKFQPKFMQVMMNMKVIWLLLFRVEEKTKKSRNNCN